MAWIKPKTNWVATDKIDSHDYNRIAGNLQYMADKMRLIIQQYQLQNYDSLPYADKWNIAENNLELINELSYDFAIGQKKQFRTGSNYIDYKELNRLESATLRIHNIFMNQEELARHFAFTCGGTRMFDVPRRNQSANANVMGYRMSFRLGTTKGAYN